MEKFTKSDLRDGHVVTFRSYCARGPIERRVVSNGCKFLSDIGTTNEASRLNFFDNGLKSYDDNSLDIIRVECPVCGILWEREGFETVKEEKVAESSGVTLHGYPVKVGDNVFDVLLGEGVVIGISNDWCPITVHFDGYGAALYSEDGKGNVAHDFPRLGWTEEYDVRKLSQTKPIKKVKKWQWLMKNRAGLLFASSHYETKEDVRAAHNISEVIRRLEESMIEFDE